jgi:hypothetical protein
MAGLVKNTLEPVHPVAVAKGLSMKNTLLLVGFVAALSACGPGARDHGNGDDDGTVDAAVVGGPEKCDDHFDNDGDGRTDCEDVDCSGVGDCPVCGNVVTPEATPLALPDGVSSGATCSTDAQCGAATPNCVASECHASYTSTLNFIGFPDNATLTDPTKLLKICVNMEHSWLRDLQMELVTPNGNHFLLDKWHDRTTAEEVYLGNANDSDDDATPVPGTGMEYCWTPAGVNEMIDHTSGASAPTKMTVGGNQILSPGDYKSTTPWSALQGTPLNGMWSLRVTDLWEIDNGFMFKWSITFDPSLVEDCSGPIIL